MLQLTAACKPLSNAKKPAIAVETFIHLRITKLFAVVCLLLQLLQTRSRTPDGIVLFAAPACWGGVTLTWMLAALPGASRAVQGQLLQARLQPLQLASPQVQAGVVAEGEPPQLRQLRQPGGQLLKAAALQLQPHEVGAERQQAQPRVTCRGPEAGEEQGGASGVEGGAPPGGQGAGTGATEIKVLA